MLIVFEIADKTLTIEAAAMLAQRETLWVFCDSWKVFQGTEATVEKLDVHFNPPAEVKNPPAPTKRTTSKGK